MSGNVLSRREFLQVALRASAATSVVGVGGVTYARAVEPYNVEIALVSLKLPRLSPEFHGYRMVQFGDIHMGTWMTREHLHAVVELVNAQQPDLVAITGDFVTHNPVERWADDLVTPLRALTPRDAAVAVLGNHDHWTNHEAVRAIIRESGLVDVNNGVHTVERGGALLHVAGVDDYWERKADLDHVLSLLPATGAAVLLAHEPDFADISAAPGRFDLQVSGHSHGGQVVLPLVGPVTVPPYARKYPLGRYQVGSMIQYTNRGVGMIAPYVRFNCRPEITVFMLESGQA